MKLLIWDLLTAIKKFDLNFYVPERELFRVNLHIRLGFSSILISTSFKYSMSQIVGLCGCLLAYKTK